MNNVEEENRGLWSPYEAVSPAATAEVRIGRLTSRRCAAAGTLRVVALYARK